LILSRTALTLDLTRMIAIVNRPDARETNLTAQSWRVI
jgi:hypothetical protein